MDISTEKIGLECFMHSTRNKQPSKAKQSSSILSYKNEKYNLTPESKKPGSILNKTEKNKTNYILDSSNSDTKRGFFRVNIIVRVCQLLDDFILGFTLNFRQNIIKKSLEVYKRLMVKKFEEKIRLFDTIHEQISSIQMMINNEKSNL